jgi:sugar lactone lactonase YvrE
MVNHLIPELLIAAHALLGEGPRWSAALDRLLWLDIDGGLLHTTDPATGGDHTLEIGLGVGALAPSVPGTVALARKDAFLIAQLAGDAEPKRLAGIPSARDEIMNDGACDPQGRFWAGTYAEGERPGGGHLYCLDLDGTVRTVIPGVSLSNGIGWSPDNRLTYYIDSLTQGVDVFDFDGDLGRISNRRRIVTIPADIGLPDGLAIDDEGCIWVALWGGAAVHRYTPSGRLDRIVDLPAEHVTACAFGGSDGANLFITTAAGYLEPEARERQPHAGGLFALTPGVTGPPASALAPSLSPA